MGAFTHELYNGAKMSQLRIPAIYMRGGTSKGVFFFPKNRQEEK